MKLIPEDAEICVCTDFDELFEESWCQVIRDNWQDDDTRCTYHYAWSHNDQGEPTNVFTYDKIHTKDYHWKYPVHEILTLNDPTMEEHVLEAGDHIYLHHYMDMTKPRSSYFDLLKLAVKENPEDSHVASLLGREYMLRKEYKNAIKQYQATLKLPDVNTEVKLGIKLETYGKLGDCNFLLGNYDEAIKWYNEWINTDPTYREPYFCIADVYMTKHMYTVAIGYLDMGIKFATRKYDWLERFDNWIAKANDMLAICYYYLKDYNIAYDNIVIAYDHDKSDRIITNYKSILFAKETGIHSNDVT